MRVLVLSPGQLHDQLVRLPAVAALSQQLQASVHVACAPGLSSVPALHLVEQLKPSAGGSEFLGAYSVAAAEQFCSHYSAFCSHYSA